MIPIVATIVPALPVLFMLDDLAALANVFDYVLANNTQFETMRRQFPQKPVDDGNWRANLRPALTKDRFGYAPGKQNNEPPSPTAPLLGHQGSP